MKISNVLIVEDIEEVSAWLEQQVVSLFDARMVCRVGNFSEAREAMGQQEWQLVLLDLGLPDGDGTDLIRPIKERSSSTHCVVTTIFDDSEHVFPALASGADGYLLKDETEDEFRSNLKGIIEGRPPLSRSVAQKMLSSFRCTEPPADRSLLTPREEDILLLIAKGYSCKTAATALDISHHTAAGYLKSVYKKLQVNTRAEATLKAINMGIATP